MTGQKLTLAIESARAEQEHVSLSDFLSQLDAFRKVLSRTETLVSGRDAVIDWQVLDLSRSSPAQIVLCPVHTRPDLADMSGQTTEKLFQCLEALPKMNRETLEAYRAFSDKVQRGALRVRVKSESQVIEVSPNVSSAANAALSMETKALGEVEGRLESVNIHGDRNVFHIYPAVGPDKVECFFPLDKLEDARGALAHRIRVRGELTYPAQSDFPQSVKVRSIEQLPGDDELPSLTDLRGIAPDLTGDLSSEEFVRDLRNAE